MLKRLLTYSVVVTTIVWSVGLLAMPLGVGAAAVSGDLVKKAGSAAVYYLGADSKLHVFPSSGVYGSWYSDFGSVKTISDAEFASYGFGENVYVRPGTKLVQAVDGSTPWNIVDSKVYAVSGDGVLRHITSADAAQAIFGNNWASLIVPVVISEFTHYTTGANIAAASDYDKAAEMSNAPTINEVKDLAGGGGSSAGTTLTIAKAADTPASGIIVGNAGRVPFTKINLTASADGDIVIDSLTIERQGLAHDAIFSSVDVLDATTMLPLNSFNKTFGATHQAVVNDDITVPAGTTKSIILAGNIGTTTSYAGETPILALKDLVLKGTATKVGTLPIAGNYQTVNGTITIGTVTVTDGGDNPSASTQNVGTTDYILSSIKLTANSTEDVTVSKITWTQNGSIATTDVENVKLVNANTGETLATVAKPTAKKITFALSYLLKKGLNVTLDIKGDIVGGSGRDISFDIDQTTDIVTTGNLYGYNITPTYSTTGAGSTPQFNAANTTVGNGTLSIEAGTVTPTNVASNKTQRTLGKLKFVAKGEKINITQLGWVIKVTTTSASTQTNKEAVAADVTNVTIYDESGNAIAGPIDPSINTADSTGGATYVTATTTDTITVPIGTVTYTIKADLSNDFTSNDTILVGQSPLTITAKGDTTGNTITATPAGTVYSTTLTVKSSSLATSVSASPAAQTVVVGTNAWTFANLILDATDSATDVTITQLKLAIHTGGTAYPDLVSAIKLYSGSTEIVPNNYPGSWSYSTAGTTAGGVATTTYLFNTGVFKIPAGTQKVITVKANIGQGPTIAGGDDTLQIGLVDGSTAGSSISAQDGEGNTVTPTITNGDGQLMTLGSAGTVDLTGKTSPTSAFVVGGATTEVGKFIMSASNESVTIDRLGFSIGSPDGGIVGTYTQIASLTLYKDGTADPIGTVEVNGANSTITPTTALVLPASSDVNFTLKATWRTLETTSIATAGAGIRVTVSNYDATSGSGGTVTRNGISTVFNTFTAFKSVPTFSPVTVSDKIVGYSQIAIAKYKVVADAAGPVSLYRLTFHVTTTTVSLDDTTFNMYESDSSSTLGTKIADAATDVAVTAIDTGDIDIVAVHFDVGQDTSGTGAEQFIIDAGATKYLTLVVTPRADHDGTASNEAISVGLCGDPAFAGTTQLPAEGSSGDLTTGVEDTDNHDLIWSDLHLAQYNSTTATSSSMFYNGYRVSGMTDTTNTAQVVTD